MQLTRRSSFAIRLITIVAVAALAAAIYYLFIKRPIDQVPNVAANVSDGKISSDRVSSSLPPTQQATEDEKPASQDIMGPRTGEAIDGGTAADCRSAMRQKKSREDFNCDAIRADDTVGLQICENARSSMYADAQRAAAEAASCPSELATASGYYQALREAALRGDEIASRCFIQGYFENANTRDFLTDKERSEYVPLAKKLIDSSIEKGDWGVIRWLARPTIGLEDGLLREAYPVGLENPDTIYKMNFLLQLSGRTKYGANDANDVVNALRKNGNLSPQQIQVAEQWAKEAFAQFFAATPNNEPTSAASFCRSK